MAIEFPSGPQSSNMTVSVPDNWPVAPAGPADILVSSVPFNVNVKWEIPSPHNMTLGGSFQLRAYVAGARNSCSDEERQALAVHQRGVHMRVDQARKHCLSSQVNDLRIRRSGNLSALDLADALAGDKNRHS